MAALGDMVARSLNDKNEDCLDTCAMTSESREMSLASGTASLEFATRRLSDTSATTSPRSEPTKDHMSINTPMTLEDRPSLEICTDTIHAGSLQNAFRHSQTVPVHMQSPPEGTAANVEPSVRNTTGTSLHGLSNRLSSIEHILVANQRRVLSALLPQVEASRRLENEIKTLRVENQKLQGKLSLMESLQLQERLAHASSEAENDEGDIVISCSPMAGCLRNSMNLGVVKPSRSMPGGGRNSISSFVRRGSVLEKGLQLFQPKEKRNAKQARLSVDVVCLHAPSHPLGDCAADASKAQSFECDMPLVNRDANSENEHAGNFSGLIPHQHTDPQPLQYVPEATEQPESSEAHSGKDRQHGDSISIGPSPSYLSSASVCTEYTGVSWQWLHRTGYRDYDEMSSNKIESAYRAGETKFRMKSGKGGSKPIEIFFEDMIQHDPITGNTREIRRLGHHGLRLHVQRFVLGCWKRWRTGGPRREKFDAYQRRKSELTRGLDQTDFDVRDLYKSHGACASIARSSWFIPMHLFMVLVNIIWVSVDIDHNNKATTIETGIAFQLMENWFCMFFMMRAIVHALAFEKKLDCFKDGWFNLEFALALVMIPELWLRMFQNVALRNSALGHSLILRVFRLLRLLRVAHFVRVASDMYSLCRSITTAMRSVAFTFLWLIFLLYMFGCVFTSLTEHDAEYIASRYFASVGDSMLSLFCTGTLLDGTWSLAKEIKTHAGLPLLFLFLLFVFLSNFISLSLIIGILCQVVARSSDADRAAAEVAYLKKNVWGILECYDAEGNNSINREAFDCLMENPELHECLNKFGADINGLMSLGDVLFVAEESPLNFKNSQSESPSQKHLTFKQFLEVILRLRGEKHASVTDMVELRAFLRQRQDHLEAMLMCKGCSPIASASGDGSRRHSKSVKHPPTDLT